MVELTLHNRIRYAVRKLGINKVLSKLAVLQFQIAPELSYINYLDELNIPRFLSENENYVLEIKCKL